MAQIIQSTPRKTTLAILLCLTLMACGQTTPTSKNKASDTAQPQENSKRDVDVKNTALEQKTARLDALQNPDWVKTATLPKEWSGLYQKDCDIGGPEKPSFFEYRDHNTNIEYIFAYIPYPPSLNKKPKAEVYPITAQVWQNKNLTDHYLLFKNGTFSQILIEDGPTPQDRPWSRGLHQTLDGKVWDINQNYMTDYKVTDAVRWAVDTTNTEDYGSRPACPLKLAEPWAGQSFKGKDGNTYSLAQLIKTP